MASLESNHITKNDMPDASRCHPIFPFFSTINIHRNPEIRGWRLKSKVAGHMIWSTLAGEACLFLLHRFTMGLPLVTCWLFRIAKNDDVFQGRWSLCERNSWRRQIWPRKMEAVKEHAFGLHVTWRQLLSMHRISPVQLMDHRKTMWKPRKRRNWRSCMAGMVYWLRYSSYGRQ